jgi:hypothetical protein
MAEGALLPWRSVHPRPRGDDHDYIDWDEGRDGSPPRVRGQQVRPAAGGVCLRFTPMRAGTTFVDFLTTAATDHHRHLVDERIRYHCRHRLIGAVRRKFRAQMFIPHCVQLLFGGRQVRLP